jgi:hypothetical protein
MSVRKRIWTTSKGVEKEAWVVDYADQAGKRHLKSFAKKKAADSFAATAKVEVRAGTGGDQGHCGRRERPLEAIVIDGDLHWPPRF